MLDKVRLAALRKSGCSAAWIMRLQACEQDILLQELRACLLEHQTKLDEDCKKIDCIDYLIYELKKQAGTR